MNLIANILTGVAGILNVVAFIHVYMAFKLRGMDLESRSWISSATDWAFKTTLVAWTAMCLEFIAADSANDFWLVAIRAVILIASFAIFNKISKIEGDW